MRNSSGNMNRFKNRKVIFHNSCNHLTRHVSWKSMKTLFTFPSNLFLEIIELPKCDKRCFLRFCDQSRFPAAEDPTDKKKINSVKETATQVFCCRKNNQQHEERGKQPATPPKQVTCKDVVAITYVASSHLKDSVSQCLKLQNDFH